MEISNHQAIFLSHCIQLNNQVLSHFDDLGLAILSKDTEENYLFKISLQEKNTNIILAHLLNNVTLLNQFEKVLVYICEKIEEMRFLMEKSTQESSEILKNLKEINEALLLILHEHNIMHPQFYLRIQQLEINLQMIKQRLMEIEKEKFKSKNQLFSSLKDPIFDLYYAQHFLKQELHKFFFIKENLTKN